MYRHRKFFGFLFLTLTVGMEAAQDEVNQKLSEQRAESVRGYLIEQGLALTSVSAKGFGKTVPVGDNSTSSGRQSNRRVEIVVSGEVIGVKIGT